MKKIIVFNLLIISFLCSYAQIEKGTHLTGSSIFFNYQQDKNGKKLIYEQIGFGVMPNFGYAVKKNLVLGGGINYSFQLTKIFPQSSGFFFNSSISNSIGPNIYLRYYIMKGKFGGFLTMNANPSYGLLSYQNDNPNFPIDQRKYNIYNIKFQIGIAPGITYFLSKNFAIELQYGYLGYSLNYTPIQKDINQSNTQQTFNFNFRADALNIGMRYYFDKKQKEKKTQ